MERQTITLTTQQKSFIEFLQQTLPIKDEIAFNIVERFSQKKFTKGDIFLSEGKVSDEYLFLTNGFMRSSVLNTEGIEVTTNFYSKGLLVFEVGSFFLRVPSQETIEALIDSEGLAISFKDLNDLFHTVPEFREFGRAVLVKGFVAFKNRTLSMINKTAEERYSELIKSNPEIFQHAPLKHIASYLGVTDTSLSRIRKEFIKK